jgi:hypothetical protein
VTVFLAWSAQFLPAEANGPWREFHKVADNVAMIDSAESLSQVYHELKRELRPSAALVVAPLGARPKVKGLPRGTTTWLRDRLAP